MKLSVALPSIRYVLALAESYAEESDRRHINHVKNFLRSKEPDDGVISAAKVRKMAGEK